MNGGPRASDDALVVLTQNLWGGAAAWPDRRDLLARTLARIRPDIIGLQEVRAPREGHEEVSQAHELAALLGGYTAYFAHARPIGLSSCEGIALLCARDVHERAVEALSLDPHDYLEAGNRRVALCGRITHQSHRIDVFVTHLSLSQRARARTLRELGDFIRAERERSRSAGAILLGDFNAPPHEEAIAALEHETHGAWRDAWKCCNPARARGGTWPAILPLRRIDYVFCQPAPVWHVERCIRIPYAGSDHLGVLADLRLIPEPHPPP
ncbi:endonuclease/exonuclease/phosphatase family protein [Chondromyces apiculatus]|uniref:Putative secreted protein n=1 Tax=Chondromyces apiculatus DSM 436 TaxID=1192034 RepID=A0A017T670_9BACT|nr:endonuclease/exonuclease/phosphatase family protein [Chondromyces apiculatus]EYF04295.1 putative secreted protein [Chondromyces apiculatus DSM 436]